MSKLGTDSSEIARARERVREFEEIVYAAKKSLWVNDPDEVGEHFLEHDPVLAWRLLDLFDAYQTGTTYPLDRLPGVIDRLMDTKLEFYYVSQVLPGTVNALVYLRGFDEKDPLSTPGLQLARLCYSQAFIGQSRVVWERLMKCIYFLETGKDPSGKSIRRRFFRDLPEWSPRWDLLKEFESDIDNYDSSYRTPEYHMGSVLRKELLGGDSVDPNDLLSLLTPVMNGFWTVLLANVSGQSHNIVRLGHSVRRSDGE